jgi:hypothetical protein
MGDVFPSSVLVMSYREKAAELAAKYGLGKVKNPMLEDEDESDDDDEGEDDDEEDGDEEDGSDGDKRVDEDDDHDEEGSEEEEEDYDKELKGLLQGPPLSTAGRREERPASTSAAAVLVLASGKGEGKGKRARDQDELDKAPLDLPFTIPVPETYAK